MSATSAHLRCSIERLARTMRSAGLDTSCLHLEHGSKTYGRAYRLYLRDPQTGGLSTVPGVWSDGFLGTTKSEAAQSLDMLAAGVRMTGEWQRQAQEVAERFAASSVGTSQGCSCTPDLDTGEARDDDGWPCSHA